MTSRSFAVDDQEFLQRVRDKISRLTGTEIVLRLDEAEGDQIRVELGGPEPVVTLGVNVLRYSGFARMAVEYAVASIRKRREIDSLEFHILLARN
jgi:hypothetical protein